MFASPVLVDETAPDDVGVEADANPVVEADEADGVLEEVTVEVVV